MSSIDAFYSIFVMEKLNDFENFNKLFIEKNGNVISLEGVANFKDGSIILQKNKLELNSVTDFIWKGEFILTRKEGFLIKREKVQKYKFLIISKERKFETKPKLKQDKEKILACLLNIYLNSLRNFAISVKGEKK